MRKEYTMLQVVRIIKATQDELDSLYKKYIDPEANLRSLVSLYNKNSGLTINGANSLDVSQEIRDIDAQIMKAINKLKIFSAIKEEVNSTKTTTVGDDDTPYTISYLLMLSSPKVKKYHLDYLNKLEKDYNDARKAQAHVTRNVMSDEKVTAYVNAKMNSLHIASDPDKATYGAFAREYRDANQMDLLDPLEIFSTITEKKQKALAFYDSIGLAISIFNATTKIWIEMPNDFNPKASWGYVE